jgi:hypothetical protein
VFLTASELRDLTECRSRQKQMEWLLRAGYRFEVSSKGRPKVLRSAVESRLSHSQRIKSKEPNYAAAAAYGSRKKNEQALTP